MNLMYEISRIFRALKGGDSYPRKKVLVLEGGGMRGIFLTGVLQAFADRHYFPWQLIIGSSAGALTGTAYAAGQIHLARDAFFTKLLSGKFIHLSNIFRPERHILNLDWMVDTIIRGEDPFDESRLRKSCKVLVTATNCIENSPPETVYLNPKKHDVSTILKATAAIPFLYRGFVAYQEFSFLDGGLLDPIPYLKPLSMGYKESDILVVVTRKRGYRKKEESFFVKTIYENYYKNAKYRFLVRALEDRYKMYNTILDDLERVYRGIDVIYPPNDFRVDRLTKDEERILEGFEQGVYAGITFLKGGKASSLE
jgi:predicted patatin/cPLA2 family phospholipase